MLDEERYPGRAAGENGAPHALEDALLGGIRPADQVVEPHGLAAVSLGQELLRAQDAALGHRADDGRWRFGERRRQDRALGEAADAAQRHGRGRRHLGIGVLKPIDHLEAGRGVALHANRVDHPDQLPPPNSAQRLAQRLGRRRIVDRFQGDAGPGVQLAIGQQGGQRGHGLLVAVDGQLLAGQRLLRRRAGAERLDQRSLPLAGRRGFFLGTERSDQKTAPARKKTMKDESLDFSIVIGFQRVSPKKSTAKTRKRENAK